MPPAISRMFENQAKFRKPAYFAPCAKTFFAIMPYNGDPFANLSGVKLAYFYAMLRLDAYQLGRRPHV